MRLRTGTKNRYNLYYQLGDKPSRQDVSVGYCRTEFLAAQVVNLVNVGILYIRGDLVASTFTYDTVVACLNQDINQPCPVGVGVYNADDERYDSVKNNAEAVIVLRKSDGSEVAEQPTGETHVSEDPVDPSMTQAEAQQDTSLTDEGEEVFGVDSGPEMPEDDSKAYLYVKDDFCIEVVASSMERLSEIVTWVNEKLAHLTHGEAVRDILPFAEYEGLKVGSETRYVTYAPVDTADDESDDEE